MGLLTLGSAVGAAGGFIYGQTADLTTGQSLFVGNMMLLGSSTALLTAVTANRDGNYGGFENTTLALGLDGGAVVGALVAPHLDWSPQPREVRVRVDVHRRARRWPARGLDREAEQRRARPTTNTSIVTGAMTAGLWGGFGLGILMTRDQRARSEVHAPPRAAARRDRHVDELRAVGRRERPTRRDVGRHVLIAAPQALREGSLALHQIREMFRFGWRPAFCARRRARSACCARRTASRSHRPASRASRSSRACQPATRVAGRCVGLCSRDRRRQRRSAAIRASTSRCCTRRCRASTRP